MIMPHIRVLLATEQGHRKIATPEELTTLPFFIDNLNIDNAIGVPMPETIYSVDEASELLKISPSTLRAWIKQGKIRSFKVGAKLRIHEDEIRANKW
jgi:excisionase family DNA binding protein